MQHSSEMWVNPWDKDFPEQIKPLQFSNSYLLFNVFDMYLCVGECHKTDVAARQI